MHWLLEMLQRPDMTYANSRRKHNVYIGKINGKRCTKKTPTLEFTTFFGNLKWSKREFQEVW